MKTVPLSRIVQINPRLPRGLEDSREISFVPMASVSEDGGITHQETRNFGEVKKGFTHFQRGDVLLAKITPCFENGKSALADNLEHPIGFGSTEFHVLRAIPGKVDSRFLYHLVRSNPLLFLGQKSMKGAAGHKRVPAEFLETFEVPKWPLDDQIRIAHLLCKVEGLVAQRKQHLRQLDDLLRSVFLEMFGPDSPGHETWPQVEIRELAAEHKGAMRTGPFGSNLLHSEFTSVGDVAVLGIDNAVQNRFAWGERRFISDEKYQELQGYRIFPGDVIVTIMGTIGRSAVIPDDIPVAINTKHLAAITLNREVANPLFLSYSIHSSPFVRKQFASKNRGAIMSGLNLGLIKETKIKRPPIELQNRFADIHGQVDKLRSSYLQSLCNLEALYGTLSQQAFKGELDLSRVALPAAPIEGVSTVATALPTPTAAPAIKLPEPELLLSALEYREQLQPLLHFWLEAYRAQLGCAAFSVESFIAAAQTRLAVLHPDNDFELDEDAYEHIKSWVFEALTAGHLEQTRNITGHEKESGKPIFGNMVELKVAQA